MQPKYPKRKLSFIVSLNMANDYLMKHNSNPISLSLIHNATSTYFCNENNPKSSRENAKEFVAYKKTLCFAEVICDRNNPYMSLKKKI